MADLLTPENFDMYKSIFALEVGHTEECVDETVVVMGNMIGEICAGLNVSIDKIIEKIGIEEFDENLKMILNEKDCNCLKKMRVQ